VGGALMIDFLFSSGDKHGGRAAVPASEQTAPVSPVLWFGSSPLGTTSISSSKTEMSYRRGFALGVFARGELRGRASSAAVEQTAPVSPVLWFGSSPLGTTSISSSKTEMSYRRGFAPRVST
jgi:hypothetical protein